MADGHVEHKEEAHPEPNYMWIWFWLLVLTVLEVVAVYLSIPRVVFVVSLVVMALLKAALVAAYFMHLKFEKLTFILIALTPLILGVILLFGLMPDSAWQITQ